VIPSSYPAKGEKENEYMAEKHSEKIPMGLSYVEKMENEKEIWKRNKIHEGKMPAPKLSTEHHFFFHVSLCIHFHGKNIGKNNFGIWPYPDQSGFLFFPFGKGKGMGGERPKISRNNLSVQGFLLWPFQVIQHRNPKP
jgi:hypothetical protein